MTTLLRSEFIKLRTTRTFVALAALAAGSSLLLTLLTGPLGDPAPDEVVTDIFANDVSGAFILVLAVIGITGEWRHRTITGALLAAPDRLRFLANQVGALVSVLTATFVLEPIVLTTLPEAGRFGPFVALQTAASGIDPAAVGLDEAGLLDPELATLALLGWIALAFAAGFAMLRRRDVES
jgi:hypothetical protein